MTLGADPAAPKPASCGRTLLLFFGPVLAGALLGAIAFVVIGNDPVGMPQPASPPSDAGGWQTLFNAFFALLGAAVGAVLGAIVGVVALLWDRAERREAS